ncbi:hypothetical protein RYX36_018101, partial [Vicia faba]
KTSTPKESPLLEILHNHGLSSGPFPQSVKSFELDQMGRLEVHLDRPCLAQYETTVFFHSVVKANLSFRQLKVLEDIIDTDQTSSLILIDIGFSYKRLSFSRFGEPPDLIKVLY